jgi:hypothetical protein
MLRLTKTCIISNTLCAVILRVLCCILLICAHLRSQTEIYNEPKEHLFQQYIHRSNEVTFTIPRRNIIPISIYLLSAPPRHVFYLLFNRSVLPTISSSSFPLQNHISSSLPTSRYCTYYPDTSSTYNLCSPGKHKDLNTRLPSRNSCNIWIRSCIRNKYRSMRRLRL